LAQWLMAGAPPPTAGDWPTRMAQVQAQLHHPRERQRLRDTLYLLLRLGARHLVATQLQTLHQALGGTRPNA
jgi:hypothetical protein